MFLKIGKSLVAKQGRTVTQEDMQLVAKSELQVYQLGEKGAMERLIVKQSEAATKDKPAKYTIDRWDAVVSDATMKGGVAK